MGFKDGTNNLPFGDSTPPEADAQVWVGDEGPEWMRGGSYAVARRIRMLIEVWDRSSLLDQEQTFGRHKVSGAPFGRQQEFDTVDLDAQDADGAPLTPINAHIRLAAPSQHGGQHLLRRGYSYVGGVDAFGQLDAGLAFIAFQRDAREQFIPIQASLAATDALNEYIKHVGSGLFAIPPGVATGEWIAQRLFEA
jgi:deferrochelatase/peroxidase EfeB